MHCKGSINNRKNNKEQANKKPLRVRPVCDLTHPPPSPFPPPPFYCIPLDKLLRTSVSYFPHLCNAQLTHLLVLPFVVSINCYLSSTENCAWLTVVAQWMFYILTLSPHSSPLYVAHTNICIYCSPVPSLCLIPLASIVNFSTRKSRDQVSSKHRPGILLVET